MYLWINYSTSKTCFVKKNRGSMQQHVVLNLYLPLSFTYLCDVLNASPQVIITDLIDHLAMGTWKNENSSYKRQLLTNYLVAMNYKQTLSEASVRKMLSELSVFTDIDLSNASPAFLQTHEEWRSKYLTHWLKRWKDASDSAPAHSPA